MVHRCHIQVERETPGLVIAVQYGPVVHITRAIEQDIDRTQLAGQGLDLRRLRNIEPMRDAPFQAGQKAGVDIGGHDSRALLGEQLGRSPAYALPRRSHHCGLSCQTSSHERSEEHTSELQSLMRISYAVLCLKKK